MKYISFLTALVAITLFSFKIKDNIQKVKDYFSIPGPIEYSRTTYNLSWSDHPNNNYFKQEYIPATEKAESYNKMIMVEAVVGEMNIKEALKAKMTELEQRKKTDPLTNYQLIQNQAKTEYLLDFIVSQPAGNKTAIVEWNAYRYVNLKNKSNKTGIMLFAYSRRSYGGNTTAFLKALKTQRVEDINSFAAYSIPMLKFDR